MLFRSVIVFNDPAGNRLEVMHGAETTTEPFKPGRAISGFRTGPLGMGHAVLTCENIDAIVPFYVDILGFKLSDYFLQPFAAYFFHINPRHHSLAFVQSSKPGIHHLMVETCFLDDVGQGYDLAQRNPEMIATTFGRHVNDNVMSFYSWSPSKFMFEYGWGGRSIDTENWQVKVITEGPSLWGHERTWVSDEMKVVQRDLRRKAAADDLRAPLHVPAGSPLDIEGVVGFDPKDESREVKRQVSDDEPLAALAFKIASDPHLGKLTYVRVYSGVLKSGEQVINATKHKKERIGKIYRMHANKREEIESVGAGDIIAVMGLKDTTTGEIGRAHV